MTPRIPRTILAMGGAGLNSTPWRTISSTIASSTLSRRPAADCRSLLQGVPAWALGSGNGCNGPNPGRSHLRGARSRCMGWRRRDSWMSMTTRSNGLHRGPRASSTSSTIRRSLCGKLPIGGAGPMRPWRTTAGPTSFVASTRGAMSSSSIGTLARIPCMGAPATSMVHLEMRKFEASGCAWGPAGT